jgi:type II secretory pathway pseudopilin PulG
VNLKFPISNLQSPIEQRVRSSAFTRSGQHTSNLPRKRGTPNGDASLSTTLNPQPSTLNRLRAFTLVEILVVVVLMALIVLALMAVFSSTQAAFRASLTQTDVLEGGRAAMGMFKSDLESLTPSFGQSNVVLNGGYTFGYTPVNLFVTNNSYQYQSGPAPLMQSLAGVSSPTTQRTNVLQKFFILTRQNTAWTGVGYVVDTASTNYFNPLYRFTMPPANVSARNMPGMLFSNFLANTVLPVSPANTNMSHLVDGVMYLTVHAYDLNGYWMTNTTEIYGGRFVTNQNVYFIPPAWGEVGFYMFSNTLPASVEIQLGLLEDRTLQRAESIPDSITRSNYLAQHAGQVHLFRQRFPIRNVDPAAYQ